MGKIKNRKKLIRIIVLIIIIFLLVLGIKSYKQEEADLNTGGGEIDSIIEPASGEDVELVEEKKPSQGVAIPGWESITIPANTKVVTVDFYNPEANTGLHYLTFELRLINDSEEGYEVLYKSDLVKPGLHIQEIELSRGLSIGEYDAIIHVQPYRMNEAKTPTNNADMKTKLIVK